MENMDGKIQTNKVEDIKGEKLIINNPKRIILFCGSIKSINFFLILNFSNIIYHASHKTLLKINSYDFMN